MKCYLTLFFLCLLSALHPQTIPQKTIKTFFSYCGMQPTTWVTDDIKNIITQYPTIIFKRNKEKETCLHQVRYSDNASIILKNITDKQMLQKLLYAKNNNGGNVLHTTYFNNHLLQLYLEYAEDKTKYVNTPDGNGNTLLYYIALGQRPTLEYYDAEEVTLLERIKSTCAYAYELSGEKSEEIIFPQSAHITWLKEEELTPQKHLLSLSEYYLFTQLHRSLKSRVLKTKSELIEKLTQAWSIYTKKEAIAGGQTCNTITWLAQTYGAWISKESYNKLKEKMKLLRDLEKNKRYAQALVCDHEAILKCLKKYLRAYPKTNLI